jgi:hypothetical protein
MRKAKCRAASSGFPCTWYKSRGLSYTVNKILQIFLWLAVCELCLVSSWVEGGD